MAKEKQFETTRTRERRTFNVPTQKPWLLRSRSGKTGYGLMTLNNKKIEYRHFDDYNELVERLKLLIASQRAGNMNHNNEIESILEELREMKVIE